MNTEKTEKTCSAGTYFPVKTDLVASALNILTHFPLD